MRYLFCSLNNFGFLYCSIGIAQTLQRRGHEVAFVADVSLGPVLARAGLERIWRGEKDGPSFRVERAGDPMDSSRQVRHIERALQRFQADVLVGQMLALGPPVVAERDGIPLATIGLAAYLWPTAAPPPEAWMRDFVLRRYRGFYLGYNATREMCGMAPHRGEIGENPLIGQLFLLRSVAELEGSTEALPQQVHYVGDCLWEAPQEADPALMAWLSEAQAEGAPILYAQPGRVFETRPYFQDLVEAFGGSHVRVAISMGRMEKGSVEAPKNFFVRPHVPQSLVLPHARAVITSGTTTAVLGALTHGLPMLLVPGGGGAEQMDLLQRCVRAGTAIQAPAAEVTAARLSAWADELFGSESLREKARAVQAAFARSGGRERAADLLEQLGRTGMPVLRDG